MTVAFWAVAEHHAYSLRRIYNEMVKRGVEASYSISPKPPSGNIVTSTAPETSIYKPERAVYINHSLGIHEVWEDYPLIRKCRAVMFPGPWWKDQMKDYLPTHAIVGWPKTDILFDPKLNIDKLRGLGAPKGKTIMYNASFTFHSKTLMLRRVSYVRTLAEAGRRHGYNILITTHPAILKADINLLAEKLKHEKNIYISPLKLKNIIGFFPIVDAFASEHSGTLCEFLATGKPAIQLTPWDQRKRAPGGVIQADVERLDEIFPLTPHLESEKWSRLLMNHIDGKASERAADFVGEVFDE